MAQSQSNLTIGIGVDNSQLKVGLATAKAEVSKFTSELRKAIKIGDPAEIAATQRSLLGATRQVDLLTVAIRQNTQAQGQNAAATARTSSAFDGMARNIGVALGGVRAMRFGLAGLVTTAAVRGVAALSDKINELNLAAKEAGTSPGYLKALQSQFRASGDNADKAAPMLANITKAARNSRLALADVDAEAQKVFTETQASGGTYDEATAAASKARSRSLEELRRTDPLMALGVYANRFGQTLEGNKAVVKDTATELLKLKDAGNIDEASRRAEQLGINLATAEPELRKIAAGLEALAEPTKVATELQQGYNKTVAAGVEWLQAMLEVVRQVGQAITLATTNLPAFQKITGQTPEAFVAGQSAFATGGYIRGPGTATSDSIPAWLSNGEFVVNARAARRLGAGFLNRINRLAGGGFAPDFDPDRPGYSISSLFRATRAVDRGAPELLRQIRQTISAEGFSLGGLVGMPPIRFAEGGLVSAASGGRPVHLHLGSQSFALSGSSGVVDALVSHAHSQQIRSAGVKPSWFAGRPSGR